MNYPEEFAYYNDYGKIFDRDFSYITTFDEFDVGSIGKSLALPLVLWTAQRYMSIPLKLPRF